MALDINIKGTPETIQKRFQKFDRDLEHGTRYLWLSKRERSDFFTYYSYWATNKLFALFNFDTDGNFLPNVYEAPTEIQRMLYPIDDLIQYNKSGTLVIDPEQYSPELRKLSFFIYMVDEDLYNEYAEKQRFLGESKPTFMYDRFGNDGVRIFKDYYALVRHLSRKREFTYVIGPRAIWYLRYYINEVQVHTVESQYGYGLRIPGQDSNAKRVLNWFDRQLCFRLTKQFTYKHELTIDNYRNYRELAKKFRMLLPDAEEYKSTTMIQRHSRLTMHSMTIAKIKQNKVQLYDEKFGIKPWHHLLIFDDYILAYVWDTRRIEVMVPITEFQQGHITYHVIDNQYDLQVHEDTPKEIRDFCEQHKDQMPVQFRYNEPDETFDGSEAQYWKFNSEPQKPE